MDISAIRSSKDSIFRSRRSATGPVLRDKVIRWRGRRSRRADGSCRRFTTSRRRRFRTDRSRIYPERSRADAQLGIIARHRPTSDDRAREAGDALRRIAIVGVGLVGGSAASAARPSAAFGSWGSIARRSCFAARARGALDEGTTRPAEGVAGAENLVGLRLPGRRNFRFLPRVRPPPSPGAILTDVAGTTRGDRGGRRPPQGCPARGGTPIRIGVRDAHTPTPIRSPRGRGGGRREEGT